MKINASLVVNMLNGKPYTVDDKNLTVGVVIAEALGSDPTPGKMKLFILAQKFYGGGEIEVDGADLTLIKHALENCQSYNNVISGQALVALEGVSEKP